MNEKCHKVHCRQAFCCLILSYWLGPLYKPGFLEKLLCYYLLRSHLRTIIYHTKLVLTQKHTALLISLGIAPVVGEALLCVLITLFLNNLLSAPKSGPRNLQVYNATSNSLTIKWDPASGRVQKYRITYQPSTGEGSEQTVICFEQKHNLDKFYLFLLTFLSCPRFRESYCCERCKRYCIGWNCLTPSVMETRWLFSGR